MLERILRSTEKMTTSELIEKLPVRAEDLTAYFDDPLDLDRIAPEKVLSREEKRAVYEELFDTRASLYRALAKL